MGHALLEAVFADADLVLHGALDRAGNPQLGRDAGEQFGIVSAVQLSDDVDAALKNADVLVDFTRPEASMAYLASCQKHGVKMIIGTTGFSAEQKLAIELAAKQTNIAKFLVNVESRIYAQLSKQLADAMFSEGGNSGELNFQGTNIFWLKTATEVTLTIMENSGNRTEITVPIGSFAF